MINEYDFDLKEEFFRDGEKKGTVEEIRDSKPTVHKSKGKEVEKSGNEMKSKIKEHEDGNFKAETIKSIGDEQKSKTSKYKVEPENKKSVMKK